MRQLLYSTFGDKNLFLHYLLWRETTQKFKRVPKHLLTDWKLNKSFLQAQSLILITHQSGYYSRNSWNATWILEEKTPGKMKNCGNYVGCVFLKTFLQILLFGSYICNIMRKLLVLLDMYLQLNSAGGLHIFYWLIILWTICCWDSCWWKGPSKLFDVTMMESEILHQADFRMKLK